MTTRSLAKIDAEIARTKEALANVKGTETEVYARIVGYYRSVRNWNKGKRDEYDHRKMFVYDSKTLPENGAKAEASAAVSPEAETVCSGNPVRFEMFVRATCPNCPPVKEYMAQVTIPGKTFDVDSEAGFNRASELGIMSAPTVVLFNEIGAEVGRANSTADLEAFFEAKEPVLC